MVYKANENRYKNMIYRNAGSSGLKLPVLSLGLWHNFGSVSNYENAKDMLLYAFDNGITHMDLANNYGPPAGSAETTFGMVMSNELKPYRDELTITTKAGYYMWEGPYGDFGSRKYMLSSLDQSLKRMKLDYVDVFYSHRHDPNTPLEETMQALDSAVRQGKALYVGLSNYYDVAVFEKACKILKDLKTPTVLHQVKYSMFERGIETGLNTSMKSNGIGAIAFSPLAQGILTDRYIDGIAKDSRVANSGVFLKESDITEEKMKKVHRLNSIAKKYGYSLSQLALLWVLRDDVFCSAIIGASKVSQIEDNLKILANPSLSKELLAECESVLK